ncbi:MAG: acylphosphatase [Promethearchaeati archaeon SRVP18_Atabeyarchaeia-1]
MKVTAHVYVEGEVQRVGYRANACSAARRLGVTGWVRNLSDGRVEAMIEGEKESVEKMIGWCNRGPSGSYVTNVKVEWLPYRGEYTSFDIRGTAFR